MISSIAFYTNISMINGYPHRIYAVWVFLLFLPSKFFVECVDMV
ncbi:Uncharacterised protein [Turicibacter sanguinis]|nr:Uncharacterised protein [Turicibacter sanguinis]